MNDKMPSVHNMTGKTLHWHNCKSRKICPQDIWPKFIKVESKKNPQLFLLLFQSQPL